MKLRVNPKWSGWYTVYVCALCTAEQSDFGAGHTCTNCGEIDSVEFTSQRHQLISPWWRFWNREYKIEKKQVESEI